jgi:hypothetical protein
MLTGGTCGTDEVSQTTKEPTMATDKLQELWAAVDDYPYFTDENKPYEFVLRVEIDFDLTVNEINDLETLTENATCANVVEKVRNWMWNYRPSKVTK